MKYKVLTNQRIKGSARQIDAREVSILVEGATERSEVEAALKSAAADWKGKAATLVLYAYIEAVALEWLGYVARAVQKNDGVLKVYFDNDPLLREALYRSAKD